MVAHPHPLIEVVENCISLWFACIAGSLTAHVLCSIDLCSMYMGLRQDASWSSSGSGREGDRVAATDGNTTGADQEYPCIDA
jgi:hypothetical protein